MVENQVVDTANEDPEYWEKILAESDLSVREEPETFEITAEEFRELTNLELLPEENYQQEDEPADYHPDRQYITKDTDTLNADHSGLSETNEELMSKVDPREPFFQGHRIIKPRRGNVGNKTGVPRTCPAWALDKQRIRELLLTSFPKLATDAKQRAGAGRWARIIQLYHRSLMTHGQICQEMRLSLYTVLAVVRSINRCVKGLRANGSGSRKKKRAII